MVAALLRQALGQAVDGRRVEVASAGLCAYEIGKVGLGGDPAVVELLAAEGIDISAHRVTALNPNMYGETDLVIAMEPWQRTVLRTSYRDEKCVTLHELTAGDSDAKVADTALMAPTALRETFLELRHSVARAAAVILAAARPAESA